MNRIILAAMLVTSASAHAAEYSKPDPSLTPGAVASTDSVEICASDGFPGSAYSRAHRTTTKDDRRADFARYGIPWSERRGYEDDHLVPLCLGGADVPSNRWPEPIAEARIKDELEGEACRSVCRGAVPLATAQEWFLGDWSAAYRIVFGVSP